MKKVGAIGRNLVFNGSSSIDDKLIEKWMGLYDQFNLKTVPSNFSNDDVFDFLATLMYIVHATAETKMYN